MKSKAGTGIVNIKHRHRSWFNIGTLCDKPIFIDFSFLLNPILPESEFWSRFGRLRSEIFSSKKPFPAPEKKPVHFKKIFTGNEMS